MKNEGAVILNYHKNVSLNISNYPKFAHDLVTHVLHDRECITFLIKQKKTVYYACASKSINPSFPGEYTLNQNLFLCSL